MTTIEDVMTKAYEMRWCDTDGSVQRADGIVRAAVEQYAAERVAEVQAKLDAPPSALEQFDLEQSEEYRTGYDVGRLKGFDIGQRYFKEGEFAALQRRYDALQAKLDASPCVDGEQLARKFHDSYERLAPSFGYETRQETRDFDPTTPNGRLMIAVCGEIGADFAALQAKLDALMLEYCPGEMSNAQIAEWAKHQKPGDQQNG